MKTIAYSLIAAAALASSAAMAADMAVKAPPPPAAPATPPWDVVITAAVMSDYNFRGVSQSAHQPSAQGGFEGRYNFNSNFQGYGGISGESIDFPNHAAAEIDFYGGIRPTFDKFAFDFGGWYYYYPGGQCFNPLVATCFGNGIPFPQSLPNTNVIKSDLSFWEVYGKLTYTVNDNLSLGVQEWYSPSVLNSGATGWYSTGNVTVTAPSSWFPKDYGGYISGDVGYWALGTSDAFYCTTNILGTACGGLYPGGIPYTSYWTWDLGVGLTYKVLTLDVRWYDTNLSQADCNAFTSDHTASFNGSFSPINPSGIGSNWCGSTVIAKLSATVDLDTNIK
jgi:hypothetical protein